MKKNKLLINYKAIEIIKTKKNIVINKINNNKILKKENIKQNFVVIKVEYSNINYKDFLISRGYNGLVRNFPHTAGIDACGRVCYSNSKKFRINDKVFVIAQPLGVQSHGSFSEYITIPDTWVEKLSKSFTPKEIMAIGTSGFTAVKAFNKTLKTILKYKKKPVLVTGALSNVGMVIVFLLTNIGLNVEAVTSKKNNIKILKKLGVKKIHIFKDFIKKHNFPLLTEKYSVVFDNLGGNIIPICLKYLIKKGIFVSIGNILGNVSNINILPFILREVEVLGINAETSSKNERKKIFSFFKSKKLKRKLLKRTRTLKLEEVSKIMNLKTFNKKTYRYVIRV